MAQPHLSQVIKKYSDGTETVVNYNPNPNADEIEARVAEAQAELPGSEPEVFADELPGAEVTDADPEMGEIEEVAETV